MFDSSRFMLHRTIRAGAALVLAFTGLASLPSCTIANGIAADSDTVAPQEATQLCANGTWIPQTDICPPPPPSDDPPTFATRMCPDGLVVTATEICGASQVCADGTRIPSTQMCPQPPQPLAMIPARAERSRKA
jgi:hypothetical protein